MLSVKEQATLAELTRAVRGVLDHADDGIAEASCLISKYQITLCEHDPSNLARASSEVTGLISMICKHYGIVRYQGEVARFFDSSLAEALEYLPEQGATLTVRTMTAQRAQVVKRLAHSHR